MQLAWYVLRSKPNKEMILWRELTGRGFDTFYPQLHVKPVNPRSRKIRPYFPGYLFVHVDIEQVGISTFQWMPYSAGLVRLEADPATIPAYIVEAIRRRVDEINLRRAEALSGLQKGDPVLIEGGPFAGYEAIFDARLAGRERVRVLLKLLERRQVSVELPESEVRPLKPRGRKRFGGSG